MKSFYRNFIWISIRDSSFFGNNVEKIKKLKIIWKIDIIIYLSEIGLIILFIFLFNKMVTLFIILLYNKWKMNKTGKIDIITVLTYPKIEYKLIYRLKNSVMQRLTNKG